MAEHTDKSEIDRLIRLTEELVERNALLQDQLQEQDRSRAALLHLMEENEHVHAQAEQSRREWMAVFDSIRDPVFVHDANYCIVRANRAYAEHAGSDIAGVLGKPYWEVFPRRSGPLPHCQIAAEDANETLVDEFTLESGETYISRAFALRDTDRRLLYAVHVIEDVTEKRRAETRFRLLTENASDLVAVLTPDGILRYVSPAVERLLGYAPEEVIGHHMAEFYPPEEAGNVEHALARALTETNATHKLSHRLRHKDGSWRHYETFGRNLLHEPYVRGIVLNSRDISERRQAEEEIRRNREFLAQAQRIAHLGSWELDLTNHRLLWSDEIYRIFEIDPALFRPSYESFLAAVHPEDRAMVNQCYTEHMSRRAPYDVTHRLLMTDGRVKYVRERCETYYEEDRPLRSVGTVQDITQQKLGEIALSRVNRALTTLSAGNAALVRASDEDALLEEMCRVITEIGGYRLAWIGYAQQDARKGVRPMAHAGFEKGYLESIDISWGDNERGRGPMGCAIRSGTPQVSRNIQSDPRFAPWREPAIDRGYASVISLPLKEEGAVFGALNIYAAEPNAFDEEEVRLLSEMSEDLAYGIVNLRARRLVSESAQRLRRSLEATVEAIAATVETRDPYTAGHERRVAQLATAIAHEMNLPPEQIEGIHFGGLIHDLGKLYVPAEILSKPGRLSPVEFELVKQHPQAGYDIIKAIEFPWPVARMVLEHHERLDGSGYPGRLMGDAILFEARLLAVADVVESMSSHRPYRPALGHDSALEEIERNRGRLYDAAVVDACLRLFREKGFSLESHPH
jgi:PAS domain S-box-containing protein